MKINLRHRHYGVHQLIKSIEVEGSFNNYCKADGTDYIIKEQNIIDRLPENFLPTNPKNILITIGDNTGSVGQYALDIFKMWGKYFDSYVLELMKD